MYFPTGRSNTEQSYLNWRKINWTNRPNIGSNKLVYVLRNAIKKTLLTDLDIQQIQSYIQANSHKNSANSNTKPPPHTHTHSGSGTHCNTYPKRCTTPNADGIESDCSGNTSTELDNLNIFKNYIRMAERQTHRIESSQCSFQNSNSK